MKVNFFSLNTIYIHDSMSHVTSLSDQLRIYMLKLRFLQRGSRITVVTPSPLGELDVSLLLCYYFLFLCFSSRRRSGRVWRLVRAPRDGPTPRPGLQQCLQKGYYCRQMHFFQRLQVRVLIEWLKVFKRYSKHELYILFIYLYSKYIYILIQCAIHCTLYVYSIY